MLRFQPGGEDLRLFVHEIGVDHHQGLGGNRGIETDRAGAVGIRLVESFKQGVTQRSFHEDIEAAACRFGGGGSTPGLVGTGCGFQYGAGHRWVDARARHLQIEISADRKNGIAKFLGAESTHVVPPEEVVHRIDEEGVIVPGVRHAIGIRFDDESMHVLHRPVPIDHFAGKPVEKFRVRWLVTESAEIITASDNAAAEVMLPHPVCGDARGRGVCITEQPVCKGQPGTGTLLMDCGFRIKFIAAQHPWDTGSDRTSRQVRIATGQDGGSGSALVEGYCTENIHPS